jgi:hypothetical protein
MATPGNFGGGSAGPDQVFLEITGTPPSAKRQARRGGGAPSGAQSPEPPLSPVPSALCGKSRTPRPQITRGRRERLAARSRGFLSAIHNRKTSRFLQANSDARKPAPHLVPGRSPPAGSAEGRSDGPKLGGRQFRWRLRLVPRGR